MTVERADWDDHGRSSAGRFWTGFDAVVLQSSGGHISRPATPTHFVGMSMGSPVLNSCRCEVGTIDIIPAGVDVEWEDAGEISFLAINVSPMLVASAAESMGKNAADIEITPQLAVRDARLEHVAWAIKAELDYGEPVDRLYADSLGIALAAGMLHRYSGRALDRNPRRLSKRQMRRVDDYIHAHLDGNLSLVSLAGVAGLGASLFKTTFKATTGLPVHQYVIRRRVEVAVQMLMAGRLPISDVALAVGFADQSHLARCMRRALGTTPGAMLRSLK